MKQTKKGIRMSTCIKGNKHEKEKKKTTWFGLSNPRFLGGSTDETIFCHLLYILPTLTLSPYCRARCARSVNVLVISDSWSDITDLTWLLIESYVTLTVLTVFIIAWPRWQPRGQSGCLVVVLIGASSRENLSSGFPTRLDSNRPALLQRPTRISDLASLGIILSSHWTTKALIRLRFVEWPDMCRSPYFQQSNIYQTPYLCKKAFLPLFQTIS